jgi:long-chain fatty acid transport protein
MVVMCSGLYSNGFNLNSNGSKALAMGGAFVGLADDYSAAFWNPAGLTQLKETTLSIFMVDIIPSGVGYQFSIPGLVNVDATAVTKHYLSGSFGFFKPLSDKVVIGLYTYVPTGLGVEWEGSELWALTQGVKYRWRTYVGIVTIAPAIAFKLSDKFSLGATFNINYGFAEIEKPGLGQYEESSDGMALGATVGMLFKPTEKLSFGLTYRTPLKVKLKGEASMAGAPLLGLPRTDDAEREANFPMWVAGGIAFKPSDKLTLTADVQWTNWKTMDSIPMTFTNAGWKAYFESGADLDLRWKDALQFRVGMEYKATGKLALRAGYYNDQNPGNSKTLTILLPEHAYNWITCGIGFISDKLTVDLGFEYGFGDTIDISPTELGATDPGMPGTHKMKIMSPNITLTYRF